MRHEETCQSARSRQRRGRVVDKQKKSILHAFDCFDAACLVRSGTFLSCLKSSIYIYIYIYIIIFFCFSKIMICFSIKIHVELFFSRSRPGACGQRIFAGYRLLGAPTGPIWLLCALLGALAESIWLQANAPTTAPSTR